jgi:hypothetical protein
MANKYPTIEEVVKYFAECGIRKESIAEWWYHEKNAIGWMMGKHKIVNWKSAASVFILGELERHPELVKQQSSPKSNNLFEDEKMKEALRQYEAGGQKQR